MGKYLSYNDLINFIQGAGVLGTGGGGLISVGEEIIKNIVEQEKRVCLVDSSEVEDGATGISTAILGGGISKKDLKTIDLVQKAPLSTKAAIDLQRHLNKNFDFVFSAELGPQNSMEAIQLAAFLDLPLLDGDFVGRAVPEMQQSALSLYDIPLTPFAIRTFHDDSVIVSESGSNYRSEAICRGIATNSGGLICIAGFLLTGKQAKNIIISNTISKCVELGQIINNSCKNIIKKIAQYLNGQVVFQGIVSEIKKTDNNSFFIGEIYLNGVGAFNGQTYKIWYKNEYLISWKNNEVDITCPDLICIVNSSSGIGKVSYGNGFRNEINLNEELTIIGIPAEKIWKNGKGLKIMSPKHFGFDIDYKPLELN